MSHPISDAMVGMTAEERANYKADVYGSRPTPDALTAGTRMVAIIDGPTSVNGLLEVTLALWIDFGFGFELQDLDNPAYFTSSWFGNPLRFRNPPILVDDPTGDIVRTWTDSQGVEQTRTLREDPDQALMQACMDALESFVGSGGEM